MNQRTGAPALTAAEASLAKRSKFWLNISATFFAYRLYSSLLDQELRGSRILVSTSWMLVGKERLKMGRVSYLAFRRLPSWIALMMLRVAWMLMR